MTTTTDTDVYVTALQVAEIFADETYQRVLDVPRSRKYAAAWDRRLAGILEVSDRGEGHQPARFAVLDGQHRWAAAKFLASPPALVANVHTGLSVAEEAALFDKLNRQRKQTNAWDHWKARRAAGDEKVLAIEAVIARHGLKIDPAPRDGHISCISTLERVEKISLDVLDETFGVIASVWGHRREGYDAALVHGLALVLHFLRDQLDHQRLVDALQDTMPRQIRLQATALRDMQPGSLYTITAVVITGLYNKRPGRRIDVTNKTFGGIGVHNARPKPANAPKNERTLRAERQRQRDRESVRPVLEQVGTSTPHTLNVPDALPPQRAYTDEQADAVEQLDGKPVSEIAEQLGISARTVRLIRADLGLGEVSA